MTVEKYGILKGYRLWALVVAFGLMFSAFAQAQDWKTNFEDTRLLFKGFENGKAFEGRFTKFESTIDFDLKNPEKSRIDIVIDTNKVTLNGNGLSILKGKDLLNVVSFPKATFSSRQVKKLDGQEYEALGTLTIRDKSHPVTFRFKANENVLADNQKQLTIDGNLKLNRHDYNVGMGELVSDTIIAADVTVVVLLKADARQ